MNRAKSFQWSGLLLVALTAAWSRLASAQTVDVLNPNPNGDVNSAIQLPDGKILLGGSFSLVGGQTHSNLARLFPSGLVDPAFTNSIWKGSGSPLVTCFALHTNGQVLVGGCFDRLNNQSSCYNIGRFSSDGTLDTSFHLGWMGLNAGVTSLLIQPDNKILVGGSFTSINSQSVTGICRVNWDGSLDTNFTATVNGTVHSVALQPDGKILLEGPFTRVNGQPSTNLARLHPDGSTDSGFQLPVFSCRGIYPAIGFDGVVLVQSDGKILVGSVYDRVNGQAHTNIVRLNSDGTIDSSFNAQADLYDCWGVQSLTLQTDGKLLVGHDSITMDGVSCPYFSRLNADGTLDSTFSSNLVTGSMLHSVALQADGDILLGGPFSALAGQARHSLGRLINTEAATQNLSYDGTNITWLRGGTSPELWRATFEFSADGVNWTYLGDGGRIGGGWQLAGVVVPGNASIRAHGFVVGGRSNGSCWYVETVFPQAAPLFVTGDGSLGWGTNGFGCSVSGTAGSTAVVERSSDLVNWSPLMTNLLFNTPFYFCDPCSTNSPQQFYRARLQ